MQQEQNTLQPQTSELLLDEMDSFSKKRISLHKVAIYDPKNPDAPKRYDYHLVIVDLAMTMNITVSETAIINLIKSIK